MEDLRGVKVERNPRVVFRDLSEDEGAVLLHLDTGAYHGVNAVGGAIWKLLDEEVRVDKIVEKLRSLLVGAPPDLGDEVWEFLQDLDRRDLVRIDRPFSDTGLTEPSPVRQATLTSNAPARDSAPSRAEDQHRSRRSRSMRAHPSKPDPEGAR